MSRVRLRWFTFESDALYPESRDQRLADRQRLAHPHAPRSPKVVDVCSQPVPVLAPRACTERRERLPRAVRDTQRRAAMRKDLDRGLAMSLVMTLYGVGEVEIENALRAGKEA